MITIFEVIKVEDDKYTCINTNDNNSEIVAGVFPTATQSFYYSLKELDKTFEKPFVIRFYRN